MPKIPDHVPFAVIGAGPAGLTAAYALSRRGHHPLVLESSGYLGGISRTHRWEGNRLDIGGHRFFTKSEEVQRLWAEMMDEPMLRVPRLSRIYYHGKFFQYPLQIADTVGNLGLVESVLVVLSYLRAKMKPELPEESFEQWVRNRFGDRLYRTFFKTYTEKVWGIPCSVIQADWAAQRIHGLSFFSAVLNALRNSGQVKSLIKTFDYPRLGPGMLWESCARKIGEAGGTVLNHSRVARLHHRDGRVTSIEVTDGEQSHTVQVDAVISTMPLSTLARQLDPPPPAHVLEAADGLKYRDFLIVALACRTADVFPDNWIYIHSPEVRVGRIQNFRNWSPDLVAPGNGTTLGMEYFCCRGDDLWNRSDDDLVALAKREIVSLGLVEENDITAGHVVRERNAYPVYDAAYREHVDTLRAYFTKNFTNLQTAGRNGLHRYNNQDHSMLAGHHAALTLLGRKDLDPWEVNTERSYYEEHVLTPDKKHEGTDILIADKAPPHASAGHDPRRGHIKKPAAKWKLVVFGVVVALILFDLLLKFLVAHAHVNDAIPESLRATARKIYRLNTPILQYVHGRHDPVLGYRMKEGTFSFSSAEFTNHFRFNSLGLRAPEEALQSPEIIFLGDSVTLGWGVEEEETFVQRVAAELGLRGLNAGVSSYGTARQMLLLHQLDTTAVRWIVLQHHPNDGRENLAFHLGDGSLQTMSGEEFDRLSRHEQAKERGMWFRHLRAFLRGHLPRAANKPSMEIDPEQEVVPFLRALDSVTDRVPEKVGLLIFDANDYNRISPVFRNLVVQEVQDGDYPEWIESMIFLDLSESVGPGDSFIYDGHPHAGGHGKMVAQIVKAIRAVEEAEDPGLSTFSTPRVQRAPTRAD